MDQADRNDRGTFDAALQIGDAAAGTRAVPSSAAA